MTPCRSSNSTSPLPSPLHSCLAEAPMQSMIWAGEAGQEQSFTHLSVNTVHRFSHKRFSSDDDDVQPIVLLWMRQQPKEFYAAGIGTPIKRWDKCINIGGDYAEK
ncbi:hypothetical protein AVEN_206095-1 [Araneus ventricosus]|uniref:Uncharacterized protein n=1 Tax=Araneus ventricosus TaxID=182803 RepID=A0A4Y2WCP9_ARAVE|nr:hypothetical protein AVEN_206095-1 [Araneus ventricosus]